MNGLSDCSRDISQAGKPADHLHKACHPADSDHLGTYSIVSNARDSSVTFAERILELELRLQSECSLPLIRALMDSYTQAIEYWECLGDRRYMHLQDRMHWLLRRKDVAAVLNSTSKQRKTKPLANLPVHLCQNQTPVCTPQSYFPETTLEAEGKPKCAEDLLSSAAVEAKSVVENVQKDLKIQNEGLLRRLEARKEKISGLKRTEDAGISPDGECEESPPSFPKPNYEDALESLLEQLFSKRLTAQREVEGKYLAQVQELRSSSSPTNSLISQVIDQLGKAETAEIAELEKYFAMERSKEIAALKAQYLA